MSETITRIYDYLRVRRGLYFSVLLLLTVVLVVLVTRQRYKEDITDFLPLGSKYGQALKVYQEISGANRIVAIIDHTDTTTVGATPDDLTAAVDAFAAIVAERDTTGIATTMVTQIDMEQMEQLGEFIYANMPYFLTATDYARMDSLLATDGYVGSQIAACKEQLLFPMSGLMAQNVQHDPLNFFTPTVATLQQRQAAVNYESYDGYIFTPDMSRALVLFQSPYGGSETSANARLLRFLEDCAEAVDCPGVSIRFIGGPVIAVGNAERIKSDSILAVSLALLLIVGLLFTAFRRVSRLLLIVLAIAWGWIFAMGVLALLRDSVSVIVIGISSVIVGIAVNYPLHLIAHLRHTPSVRQALREIAVPLVVGNITTVGAFLALVPLESVALRDLGLFSSLLLVGTILFVLIFLPQMMGNCLTPAPEERGEPQQSFLHFSHPFGSRAGWAVGTALLLVTLVLGYFSLDTTFDTNIANINYMTPQQRQDMKYFASMVSGLPSSDTNFSPLTSHSSPLKTVYIVSTDTSFDAAFSRFAAIHPLLEQLKSEGKVANESSCHPFLCSLQEQESRLSLWRDFVSRHGHQLETSILSAAKAEGFADGTFDAFLSLLHSDLHPQPIDHFSPLTTTILASCLAPTVTASHSDSGLVSHASSADPSTPGSASCAAPSVIATLNTTLSPEEITSRLSSLPSPHYYAFDVESMNSSIATRLSDDFNYIGWSCGLIVFFFLWFSLGSIELALLSFLPMAVSWLWILGLMSLLGIHFNVVNIILATFIFGQGDDYTIFMTEGCQYEYAFRRPMLASYKKSIILSALIMFIGIGTLIFAQHPALRSLAEVTIVGMFSVVLMAWLLPPLVFRWLVTNSTGYRRRPLSLSLLWHRFRGEHPSTPSYLRHLVYDRYRYKGLAITTTVGRNLRRYVNTTPSACQQPVAVINSGYGELPLLLALQQPSRPVIAIEADDEKLLIARHSANALVTNITFLKKGGLEQIPNIQSIHPNLQLLLLNPSPEDTLSYAPYHPEVPLAS